MEMFDHERLNVYHVAIDFLAVADSVVGAFPAGRSYLGDQLHRAATSIVLNIAEGAGEFSKKEKSALLPDGFAIGNRMCCYCGCL